MDIDAKHYSNIPKIIDAAILVALLTAAGQGYQWAVIPLIVLFAFRACLMVIASVVALQIGGYVEKVPRVNNIGITLISLLIHACAIYQLHVLGYLFIAGVFTTVLVMELLGTIVRGFKNMQTQ